MSITTIDSALNPVLGATRSGERTLTPREYMQRSAALCAISSPEPKCIGHVFAGIFFDGTGNNMDEDHGPPEKPKEPRQQKHSNVVRLYHAHPEKLKIGNNGYYRYYIPGVGTPFPEIGDEGGLLGSSFGFKGTARIIWGLTRVFNAVSQYGYRGDFIPDEDAAAMANDSGLFDSNKDQEILRYLRLGDKKQSELQAKIANRLPKLESLTINVFGFSRGAAEARAFVNWFFKICKGEDGGWRFAGIPVRVQFLGLFDTVASVGIAGAYTIAEGHLGWADHNMQVHPAVERCVHMVAGHEVRACFPLDSVRIGAEYPPNVVEYVYPGSHSDVGGGYMPLCLGKNDWDDSAHAPDRQLARVPGFEMYCAARAAGVPLLPLVAGGAFDALDEKVAAALKPSPETVKAFDRYCSSAAVSCGPVEDMAEQHTSLYFTHRWHMGIRGYDVAAEIRRARGKPNQGHDFRDEPNWMLDTQLALIYVVAGLCEEVEERLKHEGKDQIVRQRYDAREGTYLDGAAMLLGRSAGAAVGGLPGGAAGAAVGKAAPGVGWRHLKLYPRPGAARQTELEEMARKAPGLWKQWLKFINSESEADVRDVAVERDGVRLLTALRSEALPQEITKFFDELVHDSMAGFIGFGMPEFQVNGFGLAKFRRIFFGDEGDEMLRKEVENSNRNQIADAVAFRRKIWRQQHEGLNAWR